MDYSILEAVDSGGAADPGDAQATRPIQRSTSPATPTGTALGSFPVPEPGWVDQEALARFVPVRPEPVSVLPAGGVWRVRTDASVFIFDLNAGTVRRWGTYANASRHDGEEQVLTSAPQCAVGSKLVFAVKQVPHQDSHSDWHEQRGGPRHSDRAGTSAQAGVQRFAADRVRYLEPVDPQRAERARKHVEGWADESLPATVRAAHLCAASYFGASWTELGQAVGLSGRRTRTLFKQEVLQVMVALRSARGEPERVPRAEDGSLRQVPRWMAEERMRRRSENH